MWENQSNIIIQYPTDSFPDIIEWEFSTFKCLQKQEQGLFLTTLFQLNVLLRSAPIDLLLLL